MPPSECPCAAFPTSPALSITEMPWAHFPALCRPMCEQHTRFPWRALTHAGSCCSSWMPRGTRAVPVPAGAPAAGSEQHSPRALRSRCHAQEPGSVPGWQGISQSPRVSLAVPGTSGTARPAQQLRAGSGSRGMHGLGCHRPIRLPGRAAARTGFVSPSSDSTEPPQPRSRGPTAWSIRRQQCQQCLHHYCGAAGGDLQGKQTAQSCPSLPSPSFRVISNITA